MPAALRNNAAARRVSKKGDKRSKRSASPQAVEQRARYSHDPAAELMPAAEFLGRETDYQAITEAFRDSPLDPKKRKKLGKLMGMFAMDYQGARRDERAFLRRLLEARNALEGYVANRALHLCGVGHAIRRTLALGVAHARREEGPTDGFLGAVQARIAATTLQTLGPKGRERVWNALTAAGSAGDGKPVRGAERVIERALILKALAARRHRLGPTSHTGEAALKEVEDFASAIRGCAPKQLAQYTVVFAHKVDDPLLVARSEVDPVFALTYHGVKLKPLLESQTETGADELPALERSPLLQRPRLHLALAAARAQRKIDVKKLGLIKEYLSGAELNPERLNSAQSELKRIIDEGFDVADMQALDAMREDARGTYRFDVARAFASMVSPMTGASYVRRLIQDQITAGANPVAQIHTALAMGLIVPVVLHEGMQHSSRAMAMIDSDNASLTYLEPPHQQPQPMEGKLLTAPEMPGEFGHKVRADAYLAPAALDLLAPPFGFPMPSVGVEDLLR